jgi:hypothetical protein
LDQLCSDYPEENAYLGGGAGLLRPRLSMVDRTSFAVMERLGIEVAIFDSDFAVHRFGRDRRRTFTIVG